MSVGAEEKQLFSMMTSIDREMNKALKFYWIILTHRHLVIIMVIMLENTRKSQDQRLILFQRKKNYI